MQLYLNNDLEQLLLKTLTTKKSVIPETVFLIYYLISKSVDLLLSYPHFPSEETEALTKLHDLLLIYLSKLPSWGSVRLFLSPETTLPTSNNSLSEFLKIYCK